MVYDISTTQNDEVVVHVVSSVTLAWDGETVSVKTLADTEVRNRWFFSTVCDEANGEAVSEAENTFSETEPVGTRCETCFA